MKSQLKSKNLTIAAMLFMLVFARCTKEEELRPRSFLMGFKSTSSTSSSALQTLLKNEADIINHQLTGDIPWNESLSGVNIPSSLLTAWNAQKSEASSHHKSYVSVTPFNSLHTKLAAPYTEGTSTLVANEIDWSALTFQDEEVKTAYLAYCKTVIEFFQPDYFAMAMEANLFFVHQPAMWSSYLEFHEYIYTSLKELYPDLPIFSTLAGHVLVKNFYHENDYVVQRLAALQLLSYSDVYALAVSPYEQGNGGTVYPENVLDELFSISTKPLAITEASDVFSSDGFKESALTLSEERQEKYIAQLLLACDKRQAVMVINNVLYDTPPQLASVATAMGVYKNALSGLGLYDEAGNAKKIQPLWREYLSRKYQPKP